MLILHTEFHRRPTLSSLYMACKPSGLVRLIGCHECPILIDLNQSLGLMPICSSTIFTIEYGFNASQIVCSLVYAPRSFLTMAFKGLTNLGGIVGIVLALLVTGPLTDWGTVWLSKRNKGIYEPEFRIFFISTMLFGVFGYAGWAVGTTHNMPWIGAVSV